MFSLFRKYYLGNTVDNKVTCDCFSLAGFPMGYAAAAPAYSPNMYPAANPTFQTGMYGGNGEVLTL